MRRARIFALAVGFSSIACAIGCAPPEGEPYVPEVRRNPSSSDSKPKDEVLKAESPADAPSDPPKSETKDDEPKEEEEKEEEPEGKKPGSPCDDDDECKSGKCVELDDDLSICGPP